MSERDSSEYDDRAAPPRPPGSEGGAPPSGPLPPRPPADGHLPRSVFDSDQWPPTAPPAGPTGGQEDAPPVSGVAPMLARPGAHRSSPGDMESTSIVNRDQLAAQMEQYGTGLQPGDDAGQETTPHDQ